MKKDHSPSRIFSKWTINGYEILKEIFGDPYEKSEISYGLARNPFKTIIFVRKMNAEVIYPSTMVLLAKENMAKRIFVKGKWALKSKNSTRLFLKKFRST